MPVCVCHYLVVFTSSGITGTSGRQRGPLRLKATGPYTVTVMVAEAMAPGVAPLALPLQRRA
jgi:hypothetical protein